jgi:hypothetical protein
LFFKAFQKGSGAMQPAGINCDDDHEKVKGEKKMDRL